MKTAGVPGVRMTKVLYRAAFCALVGVGLCAALFREDTKSFDAATISLGEVRQLPICTFLECPGRCIQRPYVIILCHFCFCPRERLYVPCAR